MPEKARRSLLRNWTVALIAALVGITVVAYWPVANFDFVSLDDHVYVAGNPLLRAGLSWATIQQLLGSTYANFWHPLTILSLMLDARLFGIRPQPMHVTNLVLHLAATLVLFVALLRATGARGPSAFVAALFAVHPLHVESVAWVAQRKDVLSTVFWMLTLAIYVSYVQTRRWSRYALALLFFALGLMAKPMLVTLPLILLLFDVWPLGQVQPRPDSSGRSAWKALSATWTSLLLEKVPFFALSMAASIVAFVAQNRGGAVASPAAFSLGARVANAPLAYVVYLAKTVWPQSLTVFYPYPLSPRTLAAAGAGLALLGITVVTVRLAPRRPYLAVGWLWYVVTLLPVSGLIQVGSHAMADRYTYVPLTGLFMMIAWGASEFVTTGRRKVAAVSVVAGVVVVLVGATRAQVMTWRNSLTLWQHAVDVMPDNYYAHNALGLELAALGRTQEALFHYTTSSRLAPGFQRPDNNIGLLLEGQGKTAEAIEHYRESLRRAQDYQPALLNLGNALVKGGRAREAIAHYEKALALGGDEALVRASLATALVDARRDEEAMRQFEESVRLDPTSAQTRYNFGNALERLGRFDAAVTQYREALRLGHQSAGLHDNLGIALEHLGRPEEAIEQFETALRLEPDAATTRVNLGNALLAAARSEDAAREFRAAIKSNPNNAEAHVGLGTALFDSGQLGEALAEHRLAVALAPSLADAHYNLAVTLQRVGRLAEAVAEFERTVDLQGEAADAHLALGVLNERLKRFRQASSHYAEAFRIQPGLTQASAGLARLANTVGQR